MKLQSLKSLQNQQRRYRRLIKTAAQKETATPEDQEMAEAFERGKIAGLQEAILAIMEKNGPVTDQMRRDVMDNVYHDSLITWIKSFR